MTVIRKKPFCYKTGLLANELNELRTEEEQIEELLINIRKGIKYFTEKGST